MRLSTFNLESLDLPPRASLSIETRAAVLGPALERLDADILCLQEVNAQHVQGGKERKLIALDRLLCGTRYEHYARAFTTGDGGTGAADVHNVVTLSRFPIAAQRVIRHKHVEPALHPKSTGEKRGLQPVLSNRPLMLTDIDLPHGRRLTVINLHLRAPLASAIPGEKTGPFRWRSMGGWAEGYYLSALKRIGQALELRLAVNEILGSSPGVLLAVAGDFNAEDHETPLRLAVGAIEDTGSSELAGQSLVVLDRALPSDRRWSMLHGGRPQMLDHILASQALYGRFRSIEVHNEGLGDEIMAYEAGSRDCSGGPANSGSHALRPMGIGRRDQRPCRLTLAVDATTRDDEHASEGADAVSARIGWDLEPQTPACRARSAVTGAGPVSTGEQCVSTGSAHDVSILMNSAASSVMVL